MLKDTCADPGQYSGVAAPASQKGIPQLTACDAALSLIETDGEPSITYFPYTLLLLSLQLATLSQSLWLSSLYSRNSLLQFGLRMADAVYIQDEYNDYVTPNGKRLGPSVHEIVIHRMTFGRGDVCLLVVVPFDEDSWRIAEVCM